MTPNTILAKLVRAMALRCGLEDPEAFALKRRQINDYNRYVWNSRISVLTGTGRTTLLLVQALLALAGDCSVEIATTGPGPAGWMSAQLNAMAQKAGVSRTKFAGLSFTWPGREALRADVCLVDHDCHKDGAC